MQRNRTNTTTTFPTRRFRAGFTLLEVIVALIVITTMLSVGAVWLSRYNDRVANELVAGQMRRLGDALKHYVDDNAAELSKGSTPAYVPWSKVKPYLPPGLDQNTVNPLGQTYDGRIRVVDLPNGSKRVDALIYTNGAVDIAKHSMKIARLLGAGGFYFDWNRVKGEPGNKLTYWNASGQVDDASSLDSFWIGGHLKQSDLSLIMYVPFLGEATSSDPDQDSLLHRKTVAGKPELNRMETDIDMNSNSVNNVGTVAFKGGKREITGVQHIQFEKTVNADPVSVAISQGGWFTIGDPTTKRTNLWASAIEADGNLTVHANSTVEGNSVVKGSSSVSGDESVGGTMSAKRVETTGAVVAGSDLVLKNGDLIFQGTPVVENTSCGSVGHVNRNSLGDLMVCKNAGGSARWAAASASHLFSERPVGRHEANYYRESSGSFWNHTTVFSNSFDTPLFVTAVSTGIWSSGLYLGCAIGVYPQSGNGAVDKYPIAFARHDEHRIRGNSGNALSENCSVSFIASPKTTYYLKSMSESTKPSIVYTK